MRQLSRDDSVRRLQPLRYVAPVTHSYKHCANLALLAFQHKRTKRKTHDTLVAGVPSVEARSTALHLAFSTAAVAQHLLEAQASIRPEAEAVAVVLPFLDVAAAAVEAVPDGRIAEEAHQVQEAACSFRDPWRRQAVVFHVRREEDRKDLAEEATSKLDVASVEERGRVGWAEGIDLEEANSCESQAETSCSSEDRKGDEPVEGMVLAAVVAVVPDEERPSYDLEAEARQGPYSEHFRALEAA